MTGGADPDQRDRLVAALLDFDELVRTLRRECPWDREQTHTSLRRYLLEETYETLDALDARAAAPAGGDAAELDRNLCEELGDLLYQIWFQALLASERDAFDLAGVADQVRAKLVSRHPHVFGDVEAADSDAVRANWDAIKLREKGRDSVMDAIDHTLPALLRAVKVQKRAAAAGLLGDDWRDREFADTEQALAQLRRQPSEQSFGELLLAAAELGRRIKIDPEDALRAATELARRRYRELESDGAGASA
ncbi:MAG: MazG family protein [Acidimicrobiaceae bacterium]|nr:MazG family protein [Acidimicrobiaceae bacterium]MCY4175628.1 MazG family protein [Acidimicrobiaceae bacterium]MCY4280756.1 MazG family protein [Acidimicrobiaceae bacterium]MCY4294090.1 MazG family protein [Acidimicrobiaceae bacterium]